MIGFGLDLAGYTTKKTSLAVIESHGESAQVSLLRGSNLTKIRETSAPVPAEEEADDLLDCLKLGHVAVDIPICLQGLPFPVAPRKIWELARRAIDKELGAMPPFADRIGAPVARFAMIMRYANLNEALGQTLFETYPAAIWTRLGIDAGLYKSTRPEKKTEKKEACVALCKKLRIETSIESDDDIDAIVCAVTAIAAKDYLWGREDYEIDLADLPLGYRLLKKNPFRTIQVSEDQFSKWMSKHRSCK